METKNILAMIDEIIRAWDMDHPQTVIAKFTEVSEQLINDCDYKGLLVFFKQCLPMTDMFKEEISRMSLSLCGASFPWTWMYLASLPVINILLPILSLFYLVILQFFNLGLGLRRMSMSAMPVGILPSATPCSPYIKPQ